MVTLANPLPPSRWAVPVSTRLKDVQERTRLSVADETFQALGFEKRPAVQVGEHQSLWAWVHPAGFLAAAGGSTLGGGDPVLFSVRLSAVINEGLFPMVPAWKDYRGHSWSDLSGERLCAYMVPLDPELSSGPDGRGSTLLRALAGLQKKGRVEGFSRWAAETYHDTARQWSCVVGDDALNTIAREVGIDAWLGSVSTDLAFAMRERQVRRARGTISDNTPEIVRRSRQRQGIARLEALAQQTRRRYPDSKSLACAQQWMKDSVYMGETKAPPTLDFHVRSDGLSQAGVLATALREPGTGALLEQWLKTAPQKTLTRVVLVPDALGDTLVSQLVAAVASYEKGALKMTNAPPEQPLTWVTKALDVIGERLGAGAIPKSLSAQDGAMGVVLKEWALRRPSDVTTQDAPALIAWMEAHGMPQDWSAAPAEVAPREPIQDHHGEFPAYYRHPGESWGAALARILGDRGVLLEETAGFQSYVRHQELEMGLPAPVQEGRRGPRF